jgi:predicted ester cyclase
MSAASKKVVKSFFESDAFYDDKVFQEIMHPELMVYWHSSTGYNVYNFDSYLELVRSAAKSYESLRYDVTHIISEKDQVVTRFTLYVKTIENPNEEVPVGYFISIWKIMDGQIIECHQTSHPAN